MTEIQFLLNLLLNFPLPDEVRKVCLERIGEVEQSLSKKPAPQVINYQAPPAAPQIIVPQVASVVPNTPTFQGTHVPSHLMAKAQRIANKGKV